MNARQKRQEATRKYILISPVRDEEQYIGKTLESVIGQTIRYPWIVAVHRADRGRRVAGSGVTEAFYSGYEGLRSDDWDFIVKLDGDVGLEPDYFERCFRQIHLAKGGYVSHQYLS